MFIESSTSLDRIKLDQHKTFRNDGQSQSETTIKSSQIWFPYLSFMLTRTVTVKLSVTTATGIEERISYFLQSQVTMSPR